MVKTDRGRIVAEELRRVLGEFTRAEGEITRLMEERKRVGTLANRLLQILRLDVGGPATDELIADLGMTEPIARLPGVPGRRSAGTPHEAPSGRKPRAAGRTPRTSVAEPREPAAPAAPVPPRMPAVLSKGTPLRMLTGLYQGWTGVVRWIRVNGTKATYTVALTGPNGKTARTQVTERSLGKKWNLVAPAPAAPKEKPGKAHALAGRQATRQAKVSPAAPTSPVPEALPKGTPIRMLAGLYQGWTGFIRAGRAMGLTVTYEVALTGPEGKRGRTGVGHGTHGKTWEALPAAEAIAEPAVEAAKTAKPTSAPVLPASPEPISPIAPPALAAAEIPIALPVRTLAPGVVPKGTPIRMLAGIYLGFTGVVASVQAKPGPRPEALYTLALIGPDGNRARTSVKQSSLGRVWARA